MKHFKHGLIVGRFQPFHKGHGYLIHKAFRICKKLTICIGSTDKENSENIWTVSQRKKMVSLFIEHEGLTNGIEAIIEVPDNPDDTIWKEAVITKATFDVVIGNNEWVNGIFKTDGYEIVTIPYFKRYILEGQKIRKLIREGKPWENRVPFFIADQIKQWKTLSK